MNQPTPTMLLRQRNFFLTAIALVVIPNIFDTMFKGYMVRMGPEANSSILQAMYVANEIVGIISSLAIGIYGIFMGMRGNLKRYVIYTFAIYLMVYVCRCVFSYIPDFKVFYVGWSSVEKSLYAGSFALFCWVVMIISLKGSVMNRWIKWGLSVGWMAMSMVMANAPLFIFSEAQQVAHKFLCWIFTPTAIMVAFYLLAAALIYFYYSRRIKKEPLDVVA